LLASPLTTPLIETMLLARGSDEGIQENSWYLDTCASNHMCGKRSIIMEFDESLSDNVSFDDDSKVLVKDEDNILIRLKVSHLIWYAVYLMECNDILFNGKIANSLEVVDRIKRKSWS
jgi:hypothetical protein